MPLVWFVAAAFVFSMSRSRVTTGQEKSSSSEPTMRMSFKFPPISIQNCLGRLSLRETGILRNPKALKGGNHDPNRCYTTSQ
jgi:hypothetical protein